MAIRIGFFTLVVRKSDIEAFYPGGLAGFAQRYPHHPEDETLVALGAMSGGEIQEDVDILRALGIAPGRIAVLDKFHGPFEPVDWLETGHLAGRNVCWEKGNPPPAVEPWQEMHSFFG